MAKITFSSENVKKSEFGYPKIKLKKNEIARIVLLEDPEVEYVHNIRKPLLAQGAPVMEMKTRFRDQTQYEDYKYEFVSRPICLGDYATLEADGTDPKHCPICAEALKSDKFSAPQRRFALHVVKYETFPGKTEVKEPFQASTLIWSFTDRVFSKLIELKQEWGDLRTHDLILKCENEPFQTYDITVAAKAEWTAGEDRKSLIKGLMAKDNLAPDLAVYCGSKKTETQIGYDIQAVNETWNIVNGVSTQANAADAAMANVGAGGLSLGEGLDDLLKDTDTSSADSSDTASVGSFEDLGIGETTNSGDESVDLDDIFKNL